MLIDLLVVGGSEETLGPVFMGMCTMYYEIDELFNVHILNNVGLDKVRSVGIDFDTLLKSLQKVCPENTREFSLVKTKLEEACFYAKKSLAKDKNNQKVSYE